MGFRVPSSGFRSQEFGLESGGSLWSLYGSFRNLGVPYLGVLLFFKDPTKSYYFGYYVRVPYFRKPGGITRPPSSTLSALFLMGSLVGRRVP